MIFRLQFLHNFERKTTKISANDNQMQIKKPSKPEIKTIDPKLQKLKVITYYMIVFYLRAIQVL